MAPAAFTSASELASAVVAAKGAASAPPFCAAGSLLLTAPPADVSLVLAACDRALKRSATAAAPAVSALLGSSEGVRDDVLVEGDTLENIANAAIALCKHKEEASRTLGSQLVASIGRLVAKGQVSRAKLADVALSSKPGAPAERAAVANVLGAWAGCAPEACARVATACAERWPKEGSVDAKLALIQAASAWLRANAGDARAVPAALLAVVTDALLEKPATGAPAEAMRTACLRCAAAAAACADAGDEGTKALGAALGDAALAAATKPALRGSAATAAAAAVRLGQQNAASALGLLSAHVDKFENDDAAAMAMLAGSVLVGAGGGSAAEEASAASAVLAHALLRRAGRCRQAAHAVAIRSTYSDDAIGEKLARSILDAAVAERAATAAAATVDDETQRPLDASPASVGRALSACASAQDVRSRLSTSPAAKDLVATILLAAHDPRIRHRKRVHRVWHLAAWLWLRDTAVASGGDGGASTLADALTAGLTHDVEGDAESQQEASMPHAIGAAARWLGVAFIDAAAESLGRHITDLEETHDALTDVQLLIWRTPEGVVARDLASEISLENGGMSAPAPAPAAVAPARAAVAATSAKKGKGPPAKEKAKDPRQAALEAQLAEESEVRASVERLRRRLGLALACVGTLAEAAPRHFHDNHINLLGAAPTRLLASEIVGGVAAMPCIARLAMCCDTMVSGSGSGGAQSLARAMRHAALVRSSNKAAAASEEGVVALQRGLAALAAVAARPSGLPPPTFLFFFPLIECAMLPSSTSTDVHGDVRVEELPRTALRIFARACPRGSSMDLQRLEEQASSIPSALYQRALAAFVGAVASLPEEEQARIDAALDILFAHLDDQCDNGEIPEILRHALDALAHPSARVRASIARALDSAPFMPPLSPEHAAAVWVTRHDETNEPCAAAAARLWDRLYVDADADVALAILRGAFPTASSSDVRAAAASSIVAASEASEDPAIGATILKESFQVYAGGTAPLPTRSFVARLLATLAGSNDALAPRDAPLLLTFLLSKGLLDEDDGVYSLMVEAGTNLVGVHGQVHLAAFFAMCEGHMERDSGTSDVTSFDRFKEGVVLLLAGLGKHLSPSVPEEKEKMLRIVTRLIKTLSTPSESVQVSAANALALLIKGLKDDTAYTTELKDELLNTLLTDPNFPPRVGAAFGLAGIVKGLGVSSMKTLGILDALKGAAESKKEANRREGAMLAFGCLSRSLGRLFEPYVAQVMPYLLTNMGDGSLYVREATEVASQRVMGQLSAQGVKTVMPILTRGLDETAWRSKQSAAQLLGSMAHCAPKQLGTALPTVVPQLSGALTDSHPKVRTAAGEALEHVASVVKNPEVRELTPRLLQALASPTEHTLPCLQILLKTVFVNAVDAPSLSLLVPVILRGLHDRKTEIKKRAAKISGNMCALVADPMDLVPHTHRLVPELQRSLTDPSPEVRAVSARAVASLLRGLRRGIKRDADGNIISDPLEATPLKDIVSWMTSTMRNTRTESVERMGGALGLAEALAALQDADKLDELLNEIADEIGEKPLTETREGHLHFLRYASGPLHDILEPRLPLVLPVVLRGLADEMQSVRQVALDAGKVLVEAYASTATDKVLPAIEEGIIADNWRIRQSSVELLGSLLFKMAGTSGRFQTNEDSDDEGISNASQEEMLMQNLGKAKRDRLLARVYLCRTDVAFQVRGSSLHVWKQVVANTPRTLRNIMGELVRQMIEALSRGEDSDAAQSALESLGDLCRKLPERTLPKAVPGLVNAAVSQAGDASMRRGACLGLAELAESTPEEQLEEVAADIQASIQKALCDADDGVRSAAGGAFAALAKRDLVGDGMPGANGAETEEVHVTLLAQIDAGSEGALDGLCEVLRARPELLEDVVPLLMEDPLSVTRCSALAGVAKALAGSDAIEDSVTESLGPLLVAAAAGAQGAMAEDPGDREIAAAALSAAEAMCQAVSVHGVYELVCAIRGHLSIDAAAGHNANIGACLLVARLCEAEKAKPALDLATYADDLLESCLPLLGADGEKVNSGEARPCSQSALAAAGSVVAIVPKDSLPGLVTVLRDGLRSAVELAKRRRAPEGHIPGLARTKTIVPLQPVYLAGLLQGSGHDVKAEAADALAEMVSIAAPEALAASAVPLAGPLIRVSGERMPGNAKASIVGALGMLVVHAGAALRAFVPQLQATFTKCLKDSSPAVRSAASSPLGRVAAFAPRVDPLCSDLSGGAADIPGALSLGQRASHFVALAGVLYHGCSKLSEAARTKALLATVEVLNDPPVDSDATGGEDEIDEDPAEAMIRSAAGALGAWIKAASPEERAEHAPLERIHTILRDAGSSPHVRRAAALAAASAVVLGGLEAASGSFAGGNVDLGAKKACDCAVQCLKDASDPVVAKAGACLAAAALTSAAGSGAFGREATFSAPVLERLAKCLKEDRLSAALLILVSRVSRAEGGAGAASLGARTFVPLCATHVNDASAVVRNSAECAVAGLLRLGDGDGVVNDYLKTGDPPGAVKKLLSDNAVRTRLTAAREGGLLGGDPLAPDFADPR